MALLRYRTKPWQIASLLLLLLAAWAPTRSTAADHGSERRRTGASGERDRLETLGTTATADDGATLPPSSEGNRGSPHPAHRSQQHLHGNRNDRRNLDVRLEFVDEIAQHDSERPFDEPPVLANPVPADSVQRCSGFHESNNFDRGAVCGGPLSEPCFERRRCETGDGGAMAPKIYVYDQEVGLAFLIVLRRGAGSPKRASRKLGTILFLFGWTRKRLVGVGSFFARWAG